MSEATSAAAAGIVLGHAGTGASTLTVSGVIQVATVFFVAMGLQPDLLFAGMWGAVASIALLNNIPLSENTWRGRLSQSVERFVVAIVSAVMAGYTTPFVCELISLVLRIDSVSKAAELFSAMVISAGARIFLQLFIKRYAHALETVALPATK